ncbi:MAG: hypothetical protein KA480_06500 [Anaerolineales bacterium]|nr:hypothetical protein [Anaerolineales bacterium]
MRKDIVSIPRKAARKLISQYPLLCLTDLKKIYRFEFKRASLAWGDFITKGKVRDQLKDHIEKNKDILELLERNKV